MSFCCFEKCLCFYFYSTVVSQSLLRNVKSVSSSNLAGYVKISFKKGTFVNFFPSIPKGYFMKQAHLNLFLPSKQKPVCKPLTHWCYKRYAVLL